MTRSRTLSECGFFCEVDQMKKIIAAAAALLMAASLAACAGNTDDSSASQAAETSPAETSPAEESEPGTEATDFYGVLISDGTDYPELLECIKAQLQAARDGDYESYKAAMNPELLVEMVLEQTPGDSRERLSDEQTDAIIREQFANICKTAAGFTGELENVVLQTDKEPTGTVRLFSVTFDAGGNRFYATGYSKDGKYGAAIENESTLSEPIKEQAKTAAQNNAALIGQAAEKAVEQYGAIPDGSYTFNINELTVNDNPADALEALKSAVAKAFPFEDAVDEGTMFLLVRNGKIYAQWKSGDEVPEIGEYPAHGDSFTPIWQQPDIS